MKRGIAEIYRKDRRRDCTVAKTRNDLYTAKTNCLFQKGTNPASPEKLRSFLSGLEVASFSAGSREAAETKRLPSFTKKVKLSTPMGLEPTVFASRITGKQRLTICQDVRTRHEGLRRQRYILGHGANHMD